MKMKDLFCTLSLFLGLLALPLPGRAQNPDSLLREAAARDQQVRMRLLEMNRRVNGGEYSAALVDSLVAAGAEMERIDRENMRLVASLLRDGLPEGLAAESYDAVWLIIDHAPLKEQKRYLPLLREALDDLLPRFDLCHICGKGNLAPELEGKPGYKQLEFVEKELPDLLATADLVLSRAGSNALCEFQALGKPMLLVPYPKGASRGDQILNAQSLEKRGLCRVLLQENLNRASLVSALERLWADREQLTDALRNAPPADGTRRVLEMIEEVQA